MFRSKKKLDDDEVILTVAATDAETTPTLSMLTAGDHARFDFDASTGKLTFKTDLDFENPGDANDDNVYEFEFSADDGGDDGGNTTTQKVMVTVTALNDNAPVFGSSSTPYVVKEGETATGYTASATDADDGTGGTLTYSLSGAYDNGHFSIDPSTGVLRFRSAPDHEDPLDTSTLNSGVAGDNVYEVQVQASDGVTTVTQDIEVTVDNVDDDGPAFDESITVFIDEDAAVDARVQTLASGGTDHDFATAGQVSDVNRHMNYAIVSGNTGNHFKINDSGQISGSGSRF